MKPIKKVPTAPINKPEFLYAIGIAKIPVPKELFNKCANAPISLDEKKKSENEFSLVMQAATFYISTKKKGNHLTNWDVIYFCAQMDCIHHLCHLRLSQLTLSCVFAKNL